MNFGYCKTVIGEVKWRSCGSVHDRENSNQTMTTRVTPRLPDQRPISVLRVSEPGSTCSALTYMEAKRRAHAPVRNYLIAKLCRHSALAIGLVSVFDRLVEWTTNFLLAAENLH